MQKRYGIFEKSILCTKKFYNAQFVFILAKFRYFLTKMCGHLVILNFVANLVHFHFLLKCVFLAFYLVATISNIRKNKLYHHFCHFRSIWTRNSVFCRNLFRPISGLDQAGNTLPITSTSIFLSL